MKTTLYGKWPETKLYPDFTPYVAKYSDNGNVNTDIELEKYFRTYNLRWPLLHLTRSLAVISKNAVRNYIPKKTKFYNCAKRHFSPKNKKK